MANTDIRNPIIINATTTTLIESADFLRTVCFISMGWSNLKVGEYKQIEKNEVQGILAKSKTELEYRLNSFFAYAPTKLAGVLEIGEQELIPAQDTYDNLYNHLKEIGITDAEYRAYLYKKSTINNKHTRAKTYIEQIINKQADYNQWLQTQQDKTDNQANVEKYLASLQGGIDVYYQYFDETLNLLKGLKTLDVLKEFAQQAGKGYNAEAYKTYLKNIGTYKGDFGDKIKLLKDFIDNKNFRNYVYALPKAFYADEACAGFTKGYIDTNSKQYFVIEVPSDYTTNNKFSFYQGQKSIWAIYNNGANADNNAIGAVLGKFASASFDISASLKASPMNYKMVQGFTYNELDSSLQRQLIADSITYISSKANNTLIMNGRTMDTRPIDYWYQWDITSFAIEQAVTQLILNGVNNPNYAIRYNQNGIDTITATIVATLTTMASFGCITEFGASYNSALNELENIGYVYSVSYHDFIKAEPEKYQNEIYSGISFYLRIGRYVRQVVLNTTLN